MQRDPLSLTDADRLLIVQHQRAERTRWYMKKQEKKEKKKEEQEDDDE